MDKEVFGYVLAVFQFVLGAFGAVLWANFTEVKAEALRQATTTAAANDKVVKEIADHRLHTAENYTTKNDLAKAFESLNRSLESVITGMNARFDKLDNKLDSKADKGN